MTTELLILRLVHILGGIFWVGSALFMTFFLVPALSASGPSAGQIFAALQERRLTTFLFAAGLLTVFSGLRLLWIMSAGSAAYLVTASGRGFAAAGAAAVLAMLIGIFVGRPTGRRAGQLGSALATAPAEQRSRLAQELAALRRTSAIASSAVAALLVIAASGMAVARYLR
jgi:uncharacterized membrane protein